MNRNHFLISILAALASPAAAFSKKNTAWETGKGFKINAGEGRIHGHIKLKGVNSNILDLKVSGTDTNGGMALFEQSSISQGKGTPLHIHHNQDEVFYVLDGKYYFQVGRDKYNLTSGDSIFLPRKVPHAWTQISKKGKMNVLFQPAGKMEEFFVTVAALDHEPTHAEMIKIFADNEMEIVGPPLKING